MYVCMVMTKPCPRSRLRIWSRETNSVVPSCVSLLILHTQAESGAVLYVLEKEKPVEGSTSKFHVRESAVLELSLILV